MHQKFIWLNLFPPPSPSSVRELSLHAEVICLMGPVYEWRISRRCNSQTDLGCLTHWFLFECGSKSLPSSFCLGIHPGNTPCAQALPHSVVISDLLQKTGTALSALDCRWCAWVHWTPGWEDSHRTRSHWSLPSMNSCCIADGGQGGRWRRVRSGTKWNGTNRKLRWWLSVSGGGNHLKFHLQDNR